MATWQADFELALGANGMDDAFLDGIRCVLPAAASWSSELLVFGDEARHCVHVWTRDGKVAEVALRIDLRDPEPDFLIRLLGGGRQAARFARKPATSSMRSRRQPVTRFVVPPRFTS